MLTSLPLKCRCAVLTVLLWVCSPLSFAAQTTVAVASNFTVTAKALVAEFEAQSGHRVALSFASTGKLYTQILYGAPFDALLAADELRPLLAEREGLAVAGSRFTYARGKLVLASVDPALAATSPAALSGSFSGGKIALANPATAPYGAAAVEVMQALGVYDALQPRLVRGDNIAQAYQFMVTKNAPLGFVALAQVINNDQASWWQVPEDLYTPLLQDAVLLKRGAGNAAAQAFMAFLKSTAARTMIAEYGYGLE